MDLDTDTTIKPLYGHQEDALIGYNPKQPGRPSHAYPSDLMAGLRWVLRVDVSAGNAHTARHAQPGRLKILDSLPPEKQPTRVRGDNAFGNDALMSTLEERRQPLSVQAQTHQKRQALHQPPVPPDWLE